MENIKIQRNNEILKKEYDEIKNSFDKITTLLGKEKNQCQELINQVEILKKDNKSLSNYCIYIEDSFKSIQTETSDIRNFHQKSFLEMENNMKKQHSEILNDYKNMV